MTIEEQLRELGREIDARHVPITAEEIVGTGAQWTGRRRWAMVAGIAAALVAVVATWSLAGDGDSLEMVPLVSSATSDPPQPTTSADPSTSTTSSSVPPTTTTVPPDFPTAVPEAPYDPTPPSGIMAYGQRDGVPGRLLSLGSTSSAGGLATADREFIPMTVFGTPVDPFDEERILDTLDTIANMYLVTCCDPGPTLWVNGERHSTPVTRVQYHWADGDVVQFVAVDDVADLLYVSSQGPPLPPGRSVPGIIDAAGSGDRLAVLVAGPDPHLLVYELVPSAQYPHRWEQSVDDVVPVRREVPFADEGPCSIVPVLEGWLVLYGTSDGFDRCIGDRAALVDETGALVETLRLPGVSRQLNAGRDDVTVVTDDGRLLLGRFRDRAAPEWTTVLREGVLAASMDFA